jgi:hypothetical protein
MAISAAKPSKQWFQLKKEVLIETKDPEALQTIKTESFLRNGNEKFLNAESYISTYVENFFVDASPEENQENTKYIPFKHLGHFYAEYLFECDSRGIPKHLRAGESTFRNAFKIVKEKKKIKLSSGKGSL